MAALALIVVPLGLGDGGFGEARRRADLQRSLQQTGVSFLMLCYYNLC